MTGEILSRRIGPHGLEVVTVAGTDLHRPQITLVAGVAGTPDEAEIIARTADLKSFKLKEVRRSAKQDRKGR